MLLSLRHYAIFTATENNIFIDNICRMQIICTTINIIEALIVYIIINRIQHKSLCLYNVCVFVLLYITLLYIMHTHIYKYRSNVWKHYC